MDAQSLAVTRAEAEFHNFVSPGQPERAIAWALAGRAGRPGDYTAYSFPTGRVIPTVQHPGFQKLLRARVELTAADFLTLDLPEIQNEFTNWSPPCQSENKSIE